MRPTLVLRAAYQRTPMIKFIGKRKPPHTVDHTPHAHPASPTHSLPDNFASYRSKAQQHGPLGGGMQMSSERPPDKAPGPRPPTVGSQTYGAIGGSSGRSLGSIQPQNGEFFDRSELPKRFRKTAWTEDEIEAVTSGGASLFG